MSPPTTPHVRVAIVGAGFAGLGMAIRLKQAGVEDFLVFERAPEVGGVWRDNRYPGCACDVQSHLYSFSFAPNPGWTRAYSPQGEIQSYLTDCAERFGLLAHCRFGHALEEAAWDDAAQLWRLRTSRSDFTARILVAATGALSEPRVPDLPGLSSFGGKVMHSATWDPDYDLRGKRVAVVGTGASAIQIVPAIQPRVEKLYLFQRTAAWVVPRNDRPISERRRRLYARFPLLQALSRGLIYALRELLALGFLYPALLRRAQVLAERYLRAVVADPALRARLTPRYTLGCKRILVSDDFLPAVTQPNVEVVAAGVQALRPGEVVGADGEAREVDAVIFSTGFHVTDMPLAGRVRGTAGRTLEETWEGSPRAYLGTTVSGFPNLFLLQGPNTGLGHTSVVTMIESQVEHVLLALRHMERAALASVEPTPEAQDAFVREVDRRMAGTVWMQGGCASWYVDATGRNSTLWPGFSFTFRRRVGRFRPADYRCVPLAPASGRSLPAAFTTREVNG